MIAGEATPTQLDVNVIRLKREKVFPVHPIPPFPCPFRLLYCVAKIGPKKCFAVLAKLMKGLAQWRPLQDSKPLTSSGGRGVKEMTAY